MPHQTTLLEILAGVSSLLFGFWVFFPLAALRNVLEGRGRLRNQLRKIPLNLFVFWCFFAFFRVILFIYPMPVFFDLIHEPLGTYLFFAAGAACLLLWWAIDLRGPVPARRPVLTQAAPVGSFSMPPAMTTPTCPRCGVPMVVRTAKQGRYAGEQFYGCPNFPKCRQTQPM